MLLKGKKIGFALMIKQLADTRILKEIEKIMLQGAELFIILLGQEEKREEGIKRKFQNFFRYISQEFLKKSESEALTANLEKNSPGLHYPFLDLLVIVPHSGSFLGYIEQITPENHSNPPLVLVPGLEKEDTPPLSFISSLMKKKGIYFVPFGPVDLNQEGSDKLPPFYSRLDLLAETCAAALEGQQLKPPVWENHSFPQ